MQPQAHAVSGFQTGSLTVERYAPYQTAAGKLVCLVVQMKRLDRVQGSPCILKPGIFCQRMQFSYERVQRIWTVAKPRLGDTAEEWPQAFIALTR